MGTVFQGIDQAEGRAVAVKILHDHAGGAGWLTLFGTGGSAVPDYIAWAGDDVATFTVEDPLPDDLAALVRG